jgi:hypothetical protein
MLIDEKRLAQLLAENPADPQGQIHDELDKVGWKAVEVIPANRYNWSTKKTEWRWQPNKPRTLREGAILHQSVLDRISANGAYRPPALPTHAIEALKKQFTIEL